MSWFKKKKTKTVLIEDGAPAVSGRYKILVVTETDSGFFVNVASGLNGWWVQLFADGTTSYVICGVKQNWMKNKGWDDPDLPIAFKNM